MSTKYVICILTSSDIDSLKMSLESAINQNYDDSLDIFIVVNTLNDHYYEEILSYYRNFSLIDKRNRLKKIIRTESNGKPGMGHNSIIDIFREHHCYERLVILDGDDMLYPNSINSIDYIYDNSKCDIINLLGNTRFSFNSHDIQNEKKGKYSIKLNYEIEEMFVNSLCPEFNDTLATPSRPISLNRNVLDKLKDYDLYDNECAIYDDYKIFLICYVEHFKNNPRFNVNFISCESLYLYSKLDNYSISNRPHKYDHEICNNIKNELSIKKLKCEDIKVNQYKFIHDNTNFYRDILYKSLRSIEIKVTKKIMFIDDSSWGYNTINEKPLGGTQSAIYYLTESLYVDYEICVLTSVKYSSDKGHIINKHLKYNTLNDKNIIDFKPDIIVFQGKMYNDIDFYEKLTGNSINKIKLFIWQQHDFNVSFVKNTYTTYKDCSKLNYIFVSNWQKNRYIQQYNLNYDKCHVMQNAISDKINIIPSNTNKTKTLVYMSAPYRGLLIAYELFKLIKQKVPDVKFKVFSCFNRDFNVNFNKNSFKQINNIESMTFDNEYDKFYKPLYKSLIDDHSVEYYGSVPQNIVFNNLRDSMILFYPNTYPETCCTSILEAMAHGCNVITSELGALPETSNGFASLFNPVIDVLDYDYSGEKAVSQPISIDKISKTYIKNIVDKTVYILNNYYSTENQKLLNNQYNYIKNKCVWKHKKSELVNIFQK